MVFFNPMMGNVLRRAWFIGFTLFISHSPAATASNFTFQGQNAGLFSSANPSGTSLLMNSTPKPKVSSSSSSINPATLIEQSVVSQISSKIYQDIFTGTAASGFYDLGGGNTITYLRSGGYVNVTITSPSNGTTTIKVPDL